MPKLDGRTYGRTFGPYHTTLSNCWMFYLIILQRSRGAAAEVASTMMMFLRVCAQIVLSDQPNRMIARLKPATRYCRQQ
jgi:hypothetical protein